MSGTVRVAQRRAAPAAHAAPRVGSRLFEPASNWFFERVFARGASEREVSEREVSERVRYPIPWAGQLDNTF